MTPFAHRKNIKLYVVHGIVTRGMFLCRRVKNESFIRRLAVAQLQCRTAGGNGGKFHSRVWFDNPKKTVLAREHYSPTSMNIDESYLQLTFRLIEDIDVRFREMKKVA